MTESPTALNLFRSDISRFPPLRDGEERQLRQRIRGGDDTARERLFEAHLRIVLAVALRQNQRTKADLLEDLVSAGNIALLEAARSFPPDCPTTFSGYAWKKILKACYWHRIRNSGPIAVGERQMRQRKAIKEARDSFRQANHRQPTTAETAQAIGCSPADVEYTVLRWGAVTPIGVDVVVDGAVIHAREFPVLVWGGPDPETAALEREQAQLYDVVLGTVQDAISVLPPQQRNLVRWVHENGGTPASHARAVGYGRTTAYRRYGAALESIKARVYSGTGWAERPPL